ncbi:MAG: T9SS type A sorting domain-containing protein, partial [Chitinophagaceae bacterium]
TNLTPGNAYILLRLTTDALADNTGTTSVDERCYGTATTGEVEDYRLYIQGYDYGDMPNTYPTASVLCYEDTATAKVWAGITKPSRECTQKYSLDATGDGSEEDGLITSIGLPGASYNWVIKLNANQAAKTVYYGLWLDWDGNKNFTGGIDAFYSGSAVVTGATDINVPVYAPYGIYNSGFRLIISDTPLTSGMYNATINNGEVEDWLLFRLLASPGNLLMGSRQATSNLLKWKNTSALAVINYTIERSTDNLSWKFLGSVSPLSGNNSSTQYSYSDVNPNKENYYRLKFSLADNTYLYSNIIALFDRNNLMPVIIYPNPATNKLTIQIANSNYTSLKIIDLTGRMEMSQEVNSFNTVVDISKLANGTHLIKFITKDGEGDVQKFVKIK